jgi:ribonucleoside-diphosphate reductase alpha chain
MALERLGYSADGIRAICDTIDAEETIETATALREEHLPIFDCAFRPRNGKRHIHYLAHLKMMAAVQPFLSGAISKTINMPKESTTEEIAAAYMEGWKLGPRGFSRSTPTRTATPRQRPRLRRRGLSGGACPRHETALRTSSP